MPSRDILDGEDSTQELPPHFEGMFRQLLPTATQEAKAEGSNHTVPSRCFFPLPKTLSICLPQEEGMPHLATPSELTRQLPHLSLKTQLLSEVGHWTIYRWDSVLCPYVGNLMKKNATPHLMLEDAKRP